MIFMNTQKNMSLQKTSGIALMIVLAGLLVISTIVVEFAYQAQIDYFTATNYRNRLQAAELAKSGIQFGQLLVKYDKDVQQIVKKSGKNIYVPPLYDLIPLDTSLLRGMAVSEDLIGVNQANPSSNSSESTETSTETSNNYKAIDLEGIKSFLEFQGDFSVEIQEEESKLNVNAFYKLSPKDPRYDRLKKILYYLLLDKEFAEMFEDPYRGARELAQSIADYIDRDEIYNEDEGQERGREGAQSNLSFEMKNGKLFSLEELIMVPGMNDTILQKLKPYLTLYGKDEKIFVCRAKEPLIRAMILAYTQNNPRMEALSDTNQELLQKATEAVTSHCPDVNLAAQELDLVLNVKETDTNTASSGSNLPDSSDNSNTDQEKNDPNSRRRRSQTNTNQTQTHTFLDLVASERNIYNIKSSGKIEDTEVTINVVWDTSPGSPRQWYKLMWKTN